MQIPTLRKDDIAHIARPASLVLLAETVRAARDVGGERIHGLKEQVCEGDYAISSKHLAKRVLATFQGA